MITALAVAGYRSLRDVSVTLAPLTIVTGANGSGKSSLYRALRLLADAAQGRMIGSLAAEGGLESTLWAGPEKISARMKSGEIPIQGTARSAPVALKLGFSGDTYGYAADLGLPIPSESRFRHDPEFKVETVWMGERPARNALIAERRGPLVRVRRREDGIWRDALRSLPANDSMMTHATDTVDGLELLLLRDRMRGWRFYDDLRSDRNAPARRPQVGTSHPHSRTMVRTSRPQSRRLSKSVMTPGCARRSTTHSPARGSASPRCSRSRCGSTACCGRCEPRNCRKERCATFCSLLPC